jgi:formate-dependent nitrite reductase cytochrome c552 subunit
MKRLNILVLGLLILFISVLLGCDQKVENSEPKKVTKDEVYAFQKNKKTSRVDIYIPIKEQYATSRHSTSLKILLESKGRKPECYQCMSTEYFLAPANKKPDPKNVKLSITCAACHVLTDAEFKLRFSALDTCVICHNNGGPIVAGNVVHHPQKEMFLGYGAFGVPVTPDSKYKSGLTCIECHMPNEAHTFQGKTPVESLKEQTESICVMCHADQSEEQFAKKVAQMQSQIKDSCDQLQKGLGSSLVKINQKKAKGIDVTQAQQIYNIVFTNVYFIVSDQSLGIHNFEYSTKIIDYSKKRKQELDVLLK